MKRKIFHLNKMYFYITPSSRNFCCHFQAEANTSSSGVLAFQPNTLFALVQSPHIFSISPSLRAPYFQLSFTPVAFSKVVMISKVELPRPVPMLKYSILSVPCLIRVSLQPHVLWQGLLRKCNRVCKCRLQCCNRFRK